MSYKINLKTNPTNFKGSPRNPLDIPTGPLDKPLTNGYEVYQFIMDKCRLTNRYKFRGRPRGKGWFDSMPLDRAERIALYIDEKDDYNNKLMAEHSRLNRLQEIREEVATLNHLINYYEEDLQESIVIETRS
tara:strand:- start:693 stop:1088 length:396 start_codon:yes stop_codon:yes gene_type:complete